MVCKNQYVFLNVVNCARKMYTFAFNYFFYLVTQEWMCFGSQTLLIAILCYNVIVFPCLSHIYESQSLISHIWVTYIVFPYPSHIHTFTIYHCSHTWITNIAFPYLNHRHWFSISGLHLFSDIWVTDIVFPIFELSALLSLNYLSDKHIWVSCTS